MEQCFQLETNQCKEDEYRCHNGLCIPQHFWLNQFSGPVCLDTTSLLSLFDCPLSYPSDDPFACEEYSCRADHRRFSCGDGQCVEDFDECHSGWHLLLIVAISARGNLSFDCWISMVCRTKVKDHVDEISSEQWVTQLQMCEPLFQFPTIPLPFGHIRFLYNRAEMIETDVKSVLLPHYICYDELLCDFLIPTFRHGRWTCRHAHQMSLGPNVTVSDWKSLIDLMQPQFHGCTTRPSSVAPGHSPRLYSCRNSSKLISTYRLIDGRIDCPWSDDEQVLELSCSLNQPHRFQCPREEQCRSPIQSPSVCHASTDRHVDEVLFHELCDRYVDVTPIDIDGQSHSDETNCGSWQCNNLYTRCDGFWNCEHGEDEENCRRSICPPHFHPCVSPENSTAVVCLAAHRIEDGRIDCLGASDERQYCRADKNNIQTYAFRCWNHTTCLLRGDLCDREENCPLGDDERFCNNHKKLCGQSNVENLTDAEYLLCGIGHIYRARFSLETALIYPSLSADRGIPMENPSQRREIRSAPDDFQRSEICNSGIAVQIALSNVSLTGVCFCPSNYDGDRCQYQNQRVSLTLALATIDRPIIYAIVVTLIEDDDDRQRIHSFDQFVRIPKFHCGVSVNIYLLYVQRPNNHSKNYSVRVDVFDKSSLVHLASWHLTIPLVFLPVNRLGAFLILPVDRTSKATPCSLRCDRGTCMKYLNKERLFCQCQSGWSGARCDHPIDCSQCSKNSICVGSVSNRSICVCSLDHFGSRCLLTQSCPMNICQNNGQCVVIDQRSTEDSYVCLCSEPFFGTRCELVKHRIEIVLHNIEFSSHLLPTFSRVWLWNSRDRRLSSSRKCWCFRRL